MDFTQTVSILIASIFTRPMTHSFVGIAPLRQGIVDGVFIGIDLGARCNDCFDEWLNSRLLDIGKHPNHNRPTPLNHAENWRFFFFKRAPPPNPFEPIASSVAPFFVTASGLLLCPAVT